MQNIIRDRRLELGLTMKDVANAVGVSEATVSRWESGDIADMKRSRIFSLAQVLQISPLAILGYSEEEEKQPPDPGGLSADELTLIEAFRALPADERQHVLSLLRLAAKQGQTAPASSSE